MYSTPLNCFTFNFYMCICVSAPSQIIHCHCHCDWLFNYLDRITRFFKNSFFSASYVSFVRPLICITSVSIFHYELCQLKFVKYREKYGIEVSIVNPSPEQKLKALKALKDPFALTEGYSDVFFLVSPSIALSSIEVTRLHDCIVTEKCAPN